MNLKRVLHPEIILGRRGDPDLCESLGSILDSMKRVPEHDAVAEDGFVAPCWSLPQFMRGIDQHAREFFIVTKKFRSGTYRTYHFGKDFVEALASIDSDIPVDLLPEKFFGYISFAEDAIRDEVEPIQGAYVFIGLFKDLGLGVKNIDPDQRAMWIGCIGESNAVTTMSRDLKDSERVRDTLDKYREFAADYLGPIAIKPSKEVEAARERVYRTVINAVLYIHSQKPDVTPLKPEKDLTHSQRSKARAEGKLTNCTVPISLVSWNYQKPKVFTVDKTWIDTHPRWQRCGPKYSEVKLVWVSAHERKYKKAE